MCAQAPGWLVFVVPGAPLCADGQVLYVTVPVYTYDGQTRGGKLVAAAIDVSNPMKPDDLRQGGDALAAHDLSRGTAITAW